MTNRLVSTLTALLGGCLLASATSVTIAAAAPIEQRPTKIAEAAQAQTTVADDDASTNCNKSRKRLWVEGEGWVVRRVTTCR